MNKCYEINRIPTEIEPKHEIDSGRCAINEDLLYKGITCPSRLGFLKKTPIRKKLGFQGREIHLRLL